MSDMRKLSYDYKLPGRSIPEMYERFNRSLTRHQAAGVTKFSGRKLSAEGLMNAVMLQFLDLPESRQAAILAEYVPRFEAMLAEPGDETQKPPAAANGQPRATDSPNLDRAGKPARSAPARRGKSSA